MTLLLILPAWLFVIGIVLVLCLAARRGESGAAAQAAGSTAPAARAERQAA